MKSVGNTIRGQVRARIGRGVKYRVGKLIWKRLRSRVYLHVLIKVWDEWDGGTRNGLQITVEDRLWDSIRGLGV